MPVGGGKGPAGGYRAGKKGSYGCKGYPTVSADGTVHGCHKTKQEAAAQARAIWASVNSEKADLPLEYFMEEADTTKSWSIAENVPGCDGYAVIGSEGDLKSCHADRASAEAALAAHNSDEDNMDDDEDDMMDKAAPEGTITNPMPASSAPKTTIKKPKMKDKKKKGGHGGDSAGAVVSNGSSMGTKSLFADFGKDYTKSTRLEHW